MKIIKLQAENIKKLKAVEITPDGNIVTISGKNGQGKTSILDSIWLALAGGNASKEMVRPVRDGEKRASVKLDLGDIIVTRKWTSNDKSTLYVENREGATFKSPQKMLDGLVGRLSFDPMAFAQQDEKTQIKTIMEFVSLPVDPAVLDGQKAKLYEQRRDVNRDLKQYESHLGMMQCPVHGLPVEEVSASDILAEIKVAQEQKNANDEKRRELQRMSQDASTHRTTIVSIDEKIKDLQDQIIKLQTSRDKTKSILNGLNVNGKDLKAKVDALVNPDIDAFQEKLSNIEKTNQDIRSANEYNATQDKIKKAQADSDDLTVKIQAIDDQKAKMLKEANFPIEGLGFDEDGVIFNTIPFKQCCTTEQIKVSVAMAMALNPDIRVIRIRDGSLLDSDNMNVIREMAKDKDMQVWVEIVNDTGEVGIYIEDGEVKAVNAQTV